MLCLIPGSRESPASRSGCLCIQGPLIEVTVAEEPFFFFFLPPDRNIKKEVMEEIEKLNCNKLLRPDGIHLRVVEE